MMRKLQPNDPEMQSKNVIAENLEAMQAMFPEAFSEGKIDFTVLRQLLGDQVEESEERYGLFWHGKRQARQLALTPSTGTLRPAPEESVDWDTTKNVFIEGDNLEVLKLLQKSYAGKVKMIYIDPPYNTGKDFVYADNFTDSMRSYLELTRQSDEDRSLQSNNEFGGRYHTNWLNMLYPRLRLARDLMDDDGVIFVSIDDNEVESLKSVMNEIFGEENFIAQIVVQTNPRGRSLDRFVAKTFEYIMVFARNATSDAIGQIPKGEKALADYGKKDQRGSYRELELRNRNPVFNRSNRPNLWFPLFIDAATEEVSLERTERHIIEALPRNSANLDGCWTWSRKKVLDNVGLLVGRQVSTGAWRVYRKDYLPEAGATTKEKSLWVDKDLNHENGKEELRRMFGSAPFDFPKSVALIEKALRLGAPAHDESVVLDFFAGSGTTAHAVLRLNESDEGNRRFLLIQLPEPVADPEFDSICDITKERIRRAGAKTSSGDGGFRVYKLDESNLKRWDQSPSNLEASLLAHTSAIRDDRSDDDLTTEVLLKQGLELTATCDILTIGGKTVRAFGSTLYLCFAAFLQDDVDTFVDELGTVHAARRGDEEGLSIAIFRDDRLGPDSVKTNLATGLEHRGIGSVRSI